MNPELAFSIANILVLPQWFCMVFLPKWKGTQWLTKNPIIPGALVVFYVAFLSSVFGVDGGGFGSLEEVKTLFSIDEAVVAGWVHYLAFDLLIGSWIFRNGQAHKIQHLLLIPCMLLTFMAGPVGWGGYMLIRKFVAKPA